ncbi:SOS response-associated peptidase family protein [Histidinibacterium aquaticum]|uniref:SOS response-associated peptidase n=1 Tax=Histidinibacterium aquaticum TaxID=2613962 RepID=A0A5J5GML6_9RHOB|nr:SOS response-associated peptidase family protein [Histidinibacterium aquaticum]KAA9008764.1 SOS response-associated peptidase [Histidinibacterium aquaticum]
MEKVVRGTPLPDRGQVFAGLWNRFKGNYRDEYVEIDTYTMVTSTPNELVKPVYPDRMPVILSEDARRTWTDGSPDEALEVLKVFSAEEMQVLKKGEDRKSEPT